jgi:Secretion system C-terminal sorting domain
MWYALQTKQQIHMKLLNYLLHISKLSLFLVLFGLGNSRAQIINLVPDPSFEDTLSVVGYGTPLALRTWNNLHPLHLAACRTVYFYSGNMQFFLSNFKQDAHSGGGGIIIDNSFLGISDFRRGLVRCRLKNKLVAGKTYCARIYAVFGERYAPYVTDGLQLYFDNGQLDTMISIRKDSSGIYPQVLPQVSLSYVLTDTINWTAVMGSFVANGTEEYLTIGNFKSDIATNKIVINPSTLNDPGSTLLIDDVSVYPIDLSNWLPASYGYLQGDSVLIGLPNHETPDAKWYTYNMQLIDSGSQIKVLPPASGTKYICGIDMCNAMVFDTVTVLAWPLAIGGGAKPLGALEISPNPTTNTIHITHALGNEISIYDAVGKLVLFTQIRNNTADVDLSFLPQGVYIVKSDRQVARFVKR